MTATGLLSELYRALGGLHATDRDQDARCELSMEVDGLHLALRRMGSATMDWRVLHGVHAEQLLERALGLIVRGAWDSRDEWGRGDLEELLAKLDER